MSDASQNQGIPEIRWIPILAGAFVALVALVATWSFFAPGTGPATSDRAALFEGLGGEFTLTAHTGEPVSLSDFSGQTVVIYFGYSFCPDVCPIHLTLVTAAMDRLGSRADRVQPLFVSVDPGRDTPENLAVYVGHFHDSLVGLTGTQDQIDDVAGRYAVAHEIVEDENMTEYLVNHTSVFYVINGEGRIVDLLSPDLTPDQFADALRQHL